LSPILLYSGVLGGLFLLRSGWAAMLCYHAAILAVLGLTGGGARASAALRGWRRSLGGPMLVVCLASGAALALLWPWIRRDGTDLGDVLAGLGLEGLAWVAFIAYYTIVNPWLEELFWRGWYPDQVRRGVVADVLFAGYHVFVLLHFVGLAWALVAFGALATTAAAWRWIARQTGGLAIPCVTHLAADASIIAAAVALRSW
jgi:membrane protease YdiL (CAAX protease family)